MIEDDLKTKRVFYSYYIWQPHKETNNLKKCLRVILISLMKEIVNNKSINDGWNYTLKCEEFFWVVCRLFITSRKNFGIDFEILLEERPWSSSFLKEILVPVLLKKSHPSNCRNSESKKLDTSIIFPFSHLNSFKNSNYRLLLQKLLKNHKTSPFYSPYSSNHNNSVITLYSNIDLEVKH